MCADAAGVGAHARARARGGRGGGRQRLSDYLTATYDVPKWLQAVAFLVLCLTGSALLGLLVRVVLDVVMPMPRAAPAPAPARPRAAAAAAGTKTKPETKKSQ